MCCVEVSYIQAAPCMLAPPWYSAKNLLTSMQILYSVFMLERKLDYCTQGGFDFYFTVETCSSDSGDSTQQKQLGYFNHILGCLSCIRVTKEC